MQDNMEQANAKTERKAARKAAGEAGKHKAGGDGARNVITPLARMMVRGMWLQEWTAANPGAEQTARKAAWKEAREAEMEKNMKSARKILSGMERQGVTFTLSEKAAADDGTDVEADDDTDA